MLSRKHRLRVEPIFRNWGPTEKPAHAGTDDISNKMPSCSPCNLWKKTFTVEQFREEIAKQPERVRAKSGGFRMAERFGLVKTIDLPVVFWFEKYAEEKSQP